MSDTTRKNIVWGCPKHQGPLLGATLHRRNGPGQSCKLVDNVTLVKHTHSTPVFHTTSKTHNMPHTIARISARTHQSRPGSWAGSTGLASNCIRSASGSTLSQHTNDQRAEAAQSMRHWPADPPPRAKHASSMPPSVPVERRASQLIQLVGLCTFATADRTDVQTPRDLITPANAKRQAGGRRGSGSNLHRN